MQRWIIFCDLGQSCCSYVVDVMCQIRWAQCSCLHNSSWASIYRITQSKLSLTWLTLSGLTQSWQNSKNTNENRHSGYILRSVFLTDLSTNTSKRYAACRLLHNPVAKLIYGRRCERLSDASLLFERVSLLITPVIHAIKPFLTDQLTPGWCNVFFRSLCWSFNRQGVRHLVSIRRLSCDFTKKTAMCDRRQVRA